MFKLLIPSTDVKFNISSYNKLNEIKILHRVIIYLDNKLYYATASALNIPFFRCGLECFRFQPRILPKKCKCCNRRGFNKTLY